MIADVSKLPDTAIAPSGAISTARTGPPCPRNWTSAEVLQTTKIKNAMKALIQIAFPGRSGDEGVRFDIRASVAAVACSRFSLSFGLSFQPTEISIPFWRAGAHCCS
jgi:hypothetical protein